MSISSNTTSELLKILKPEQIKSDEATKSHYGKDWTTYFDIKASLVLFPTNTHEVQKIVLWARQHKLSLIPSGGRTGLSGGAVATHNEVVVSLEKMNQILDFNETDQVVKLQAGVITEALQEFAKSKGLYYPVDFAARGSSQIGGNIATNAGGIKVLRYGLTRDWIQSLTVVTGTGEIMTFNKSLIKNATGLDFRHLFIGSEGILGFVTEASVRLTNPPPPLKVFVLGASDLGSIMKIFSEFKKRSTLTAFEMFSEKALLKVIETTGLSRPFESVCQYYAVVEFECPHSDAETLALEAFEKCLGESWALDGVASQSEQQAKNFWRLREDISESLAKHHPYKNDVSVRISRVPQFVEDLEKIIKNSYPSWEVIWFGHIGDGNLHINILRPTNMNKEDFVKECRKVDELIFESVKNHEGSISAEHGVGLTKKPFLSFTRSAEEIALMKKLKAVFDPDSIINPGKVI